MLETVFKYFQNIEDIYNIILEGFKIILEASANTFCHFQKYQTFLRQSCEFQENFRAT